MDVDEKARDEDILIPVSVGSTFVRSLRSYAISPDISNEDDFEVHLFAKEKLSGTPLALGGGHFFRSNAVSPAFLDDDHYRSPQHEKEKPVAVPLAVSSQQLNAGPLSASAPGADGASMANPSEFGIPATLSPSPRPTGLKPRLLTVPIPSLDFSALTGNPEAAPQSSVRLNTAMQTQLKSSLTTHSGDVELRDIPLLLYEGGLLWKIPFNGKSYPQQKWVRLKRPHHDGTTGMTIASLAPQRMPDTSGLAKTVKLRSPLTLCWIDPEKAQDFCNARELVVDPGAYIVTGHNTPAFFRLASRGKDSTPAPTLCFSIVTGVRTLDFAAENPQLSLQWINALKSLCKLVNHSQPSSSQTRGSFEVATLDAAANSTARLPVSFECLHREVLLKAQTGDVAAVRKCLAAGCAIDIMDPLNGDTPLITSCRRGYADLAWFCLEQGARNDPHPDFGQTALHAAVFSGHVNCVKVILDAAAPSHSDNIITNLADPRGQTPLHVACEIGRADCVELLLMHGANMCALESTQDRNAIHISASAGQRKCLALLLDHGGDQTIEQTDKGGHTALHLACMEGHLSCVRLLLETAANPLPRNTQFLSPYQLAAARGHHQVGLLLLEYNADAARDAPRSARRSTARQMTSRQASRPVSRAYSTATDSEDSRLVLDVRDTLADPFTAQPTTMRRTGSVSSIGSSDSSSLPRPHTHNPSSPPIVRQSKPPSSSDTEPRNLRHSKSCYSDDQVSARRTSRFGRSKGEVMSARAASEWSDSKRSARSDTSRSKRSLFEGLELFQEQTPLASSRVSYPSAHRFPYAFMPAFSPMTDVPYNMPPQYFGPFDNIPYQAQGYGAPMVYSPIGHAVLANAPAGTPYQGQPVWPYSHQYAWGCNTPIADEAAYMYAANIPLTQPDYVGYNAQSIDVSGTVWSQYYTEDGHAYFVNNATGASQWEDPRWASATGYPEYSDQQPGDDRERAHEELLDNADSVTQFANLSPPSDLHGVWRADESKYLQASQPRASGWGTPAFHSDSGMNQSALVKPAGRAALENQDMLPHEMKLAVSIPETGVVRAIGEEDSRNEMELSRSALMNAVALRGQRRDSGSPASTKPSIPKRASASDETTAQPAPTGAQLEETDPPCSSRDLRLEKYIKMAKVGVPGNSIKQKMLADGCCEDLMQLAHMQLFGREEVATQAAVAAPSSPADPRLEKYLKMAKIGVPPPSVIQKMRSDGCEEALVKAAQQHFGLSSDGPAPALATRNVTLADLEDDPEVRKYAKMASMGVPVGGIKQKMLTDGVAAHVINKLLSVLNVESSDVPSSMIVAQEQQMKKSNHMLKIHWNALSAEKLEKSIWATPRNKRRPSDELGDDQIKQLEDLFAAKPTRSQTEAPKPARRSSQIGPQVIDIKRANNVQIGLAQFKTFASFEQLLEIVCANRQDDRLDLERLGNLATLLPTAQELKQVMHLQPEPSELHPAEKFFVATLRFPKVEKRLNSYIFSLQFAAHVAGIERKANLITEACTRVMNSERLARILQKMLAVGNVMNEGSRKGQVAGFTLDSLLKMLSTKGVDKQTTVLDYVVRMIFERGERSVLNVTDDLNMVEESMRIPSDDVVRDSERLKQQFTALNDGHNKEVGTLGLEIGDEEKLEARSSESTDHSYLFFQGKFIRSSVERLSSLLRTVGEMQERVRNLAEYFGEDERCKSTSIFSVLVEFKRAFTMSRATVERKAKVRARQHPIRHDVA